MVNSYRLRKKNLYKHKTSIGASELHVIVYLTDNNNYRKNYS